MRSLSVLAAAAFCTVPAFAKDPIPTLPPYTAAYQPQGVDERGIWMRADEMERDMRDSKSVINDPGLTAYISEVLCRTVGADRCRSARIYVVRDADFNAYMTPNGMMVVNSGLLLRARDEAELAAVLGHEFAHFELRHSLVGYKRKRTASDIVAWAGVAAIGLQTYSAARSYQSIQISVYGTVFSNDRDQERQADFLSMSYLKASPYDPRCFADVWARLMDEADATAHGRKQRSTRYDRTAFFATHPTRLERTIYLREAAADMAKAGADDRAKYEQAMMKWRPEFLADQIKLNDFEGTDYLLTNLAGDSWTAPLLYSRGELYRSRGNPRDLVAAIAFYRDAIAKDSSNAEAYRGMGLAQMRSRDPAGAETLKAYLKMKPDAADGAMISTLLQ